MPNMTAILQLVYSIHCTSLILRIHVMVNWHLSKQDIHWPVSCDHIVGSSLELIDISFFFLEVDRWLGTGFQLDPQPKPSYQAVWWKLERQNGLWL